MKEWPEVVVVTRNGQCVLEKQVSRAHRKQGGRRRGERENEGTGLLFPR